MTIETSTIETADRLLRLKSVLERIPVSRSRWYSGIASGEFPRPVRLGPATVAWRQSDIDKLIKTLAVTE